MGPVHRIAALLPILLSVLALLVVQQIGQPPQLTKPKIFVLGLSKTGTTSIGDALELLGYRRLGWRDVLSRFMVHTWVNGDASPLNRLTSYYDAFEDLPWPFMYREMAQMYPDAHFILSVRKDEATWLRSMRTHVARGKWQPYNYFYGADEVDGNEETILNSYRNHTANVRHFFQHQPHRFLEMNIDDGDMNWRSLCQIAQCGPNGTMPITGFPKSNTAASWDMGFVVFTLRWLWGTLVTRIEEQSSFLYYECAYPGLNWILGRCWHVIAAIEHTVVELGYRLGHGKANVMYFESQTGSMSFR